MAIARSPSSLRSPTMPLARWGSMDGGQALTAACSSWKRKKLTLQSVAARRGFGAGWLIRGAFGEEFPHCTSVGPSWRARSEASRPWRPNETSRGRAPLLGRRIEIATDRGSEPADEPPCEHQQGNTLGVLWVDGDDQSKNYRPSDEPRNAEAHIRSQSPSHLGISIFARAALLDGLFPPNKHVNLMRRRPR